MDDPKFRLRLEFLSEHTPQVLRVLRCGLQHSGNLDVDVAEMLQELVDTTAEICKTEQWLDPYPPSVVVSAYRTGANSDEETAEISVRHTEGGYRLFVEPNNADSEWLALHDFFSL